MKVMFVCAGGMSTAMTAKKLEEVAAKEGITITVAARGVSDFETELQLEKCDIVLVAPQIRHRFDNIKLIVDKFPEVRIAKIPPQMYAPMEPVVKKLLGLIQEEMAK